MKQVLKPSLEHIALFKIAVSLWNQDDIRPLMGNFCSRLYWYGRTEWPDIEEIVIEKVKRLSQPQLLQDKIMSYIKPVGLEISKWIQYHTECCYLGLTIPKEFCWTSQGTVDRKETAKMLIRDRCMTVTTLYRLACIYCFEDDIQELWSQMPEIYKDSFYSEDLSGQQGLVYFWTCDVQQDMGRFNSMLERVRSHSLSPFHYAFQHAAAGGNKAGTEYFLQKLTPQERKKTLVKTANIVAVRRFLNAKNDSSCKLSKDYYTEVISFLISQMDEEQHTRMFKKYN